MTNAPRWRDLAARAEQLRIPDAVLDEEVQALLGLPGDPRPWTASTGPIRELIGERLPDWELTVRPLQCANGLIFWRAELRRDASGSRCTAKSHVPVGGLLSVALRALAETEVRAA